MYALMRTAYLPAELPPIITTKSFSQFCRDDYATLKAQMGALTRQSTQYVNFSIPRTNGNRRLLALVHPKAQIATCLALCNNRSEIKRLLCDNGVSLYDTSEDIKRDKAFKGLDFKEARTRKAKLSSDYKYVVQADVSRFFYTIYTHSLPWAVLGKSKAKQLLAERRLHRHWSSQLDFAMQAGQSRETFGIPVGPDTSRVLAEILLAGVEHEPELQPYLIGDRSFRLMDDFFIGANDEAEGMSILGALRRALDNYNLHLNEEKSGVVRSYKLFTERWKLDFETLTVSDINPADQGRDIERLIEFSLHCCDESASALPATWACRRLLSLKNIEENFSTILVALLRLARDFPFCTSHVAEFLINNQKRCRSPEFSGRIKRWVTTMLDTHLKHRDDFEVAWCLVVCGVLKLQLDDKDLAAADARPNSIIFSIMGLLIQKGLLKTNLAKWGWRAEAKQNGVNSNNWLFVYEAVQRKWTTDRELVAAVKNDDVLGKMFSKDVSFLDDELLDVSSISVVRRRFQKKASGEKKSRERSKSSADLEPSDEMLDYF